ncbi:hypothetical protein ABB37_09487 [Leptomonas pyrrhocoris]|uniref:BAR domain-containing protein n=1 Tax=Leptomonas pyrrhocoris TaxID=157538 RepID=A0A0M9FQ80_LEPPY|nr:hypothetical protein ABB37_09487 [Leptomonas pyrrhocoris]XP_015652290.1 hypothetical protein ABB37_09487 [Leptomonas pyrrhocoris]XP_015652291.1 hypothetical protein ABB37_09487 [Leptomonas pyrrhocoris]KPA73850.1 hypothetical protein ABB37_09487 [Leptomonas pyrrhocoris]KPA73851.1 hypothetical protein ABB37_09487 [Leptomonas pyrrhocoris]KPA73852.1 hypothetical protein ABB37_09487 [Leptomonas pyrrhocoris]|eukprot:XP_015652289.1 hypothetical protein ABB37_09487 [Leptomonas pyrrhocoris]
MAIEGTQQTEGVCRAQKEWVLKVKSTATLLSRSAAQAQRNFDQYLTAMEHVAALYKDYGALLSTAKAPFLAIEADIPDLAELKANTARMHAIVHRWEHSEVLYAVRGQLHVQTDVLKSRSALAAKALDGCVERENLMSAYVVKSARLARKLRNQSPEAEELQKECDKLERRLGEMQATTQKNVEAVAVKSSASLTHLTAKFCKAMYKNGAYLEKKFRPSHLGVGEEDVSSFSETDENSAITGVFGGLRSPQSERSSVTASGIYGLNRNRYHPQEAQRPLLAAVDNPQSTGIPLRYHPEAPTAVNTQ